MEATLPTTVSHFPFFAFRSVNEKYKNHRAGSRVVFIDSPAPLPRGVPLTPCVGPPIAAAATLSSSPPHLSYGALVPTQITQGSAHYCVCGEPSDVLRFVSGWTRIAGRGGWVGETTCKGGETKARNRQSSCQVSGVGGGQM